MAAKKITFILNDDGLNRYGFRVLTAGINTEEFEKNPLMLYDHRSYSYRPVGKWENLRKEGGQLKGDAVLDDTSDFDKEIKSKVEKGIIKGASMGIDVVELSEAPEYLITGQTRKTVTKCILREVSITPDPANSRALKLNFPDKKVMLSGETEFIDELIGKINPNNDKMKKIALKLGLPENATEDQINQKIEELSASKPPEKDEEVKPETKTEGGDKMVNAFLSMGKKVGIITEKNEDKFKKLAAVDIDLAVDMMEELNASSGSSDEDQTIRLSDVIKVLKKGGSEEKDEVKKDYDWYQMNDPKELMKLKSEKPEEFKKLYEAKYGKVVKED